MGGGPMVTTSRLEVGAAVAGVLAVAATLIALPPVFGAVLLVGAVTAVLIAVHPHWGFYLLLLSIPVQDFGAVGEFTLTNVLFGLTTVAWLMRRACAPAQAELAARPRPGDAIGPLFALFVAVLALSLTVAREIAPGILTLFQWGKALLVYFLARDLLHTRRQVVTALVALLVAGLAEALFGLFQHLTGAGPASFAHGAGLNGRVLRAYGTFGGPTTYAGYLEMIFPFGLLLAGWLWRAGRRRGALPGGIRPGESNAYGLGAPLPRASAREGVGAFLAAGASAVMGAAILASFTRGAWLGTLGALVIMPLLAGQRARVVAMVGALVIALFGLVGGFALLPASVHDRFSSITDSGGGQDVRSAFITAENFSTIERKAQWVAGLNMFASNRLLGVGLGNYNLRYPEFNVSAHFAQPHGGSHTIGHAHNYYIHIAAEAGFPGLGAYLLLLGAIVFTGLRALRGTAGRDPFAHAVVVAGLGSVTAVAIHNVFENLHVLSMGVQLSAIWALLSLAEGGFAAGITGDEGASPRTEVAP